MCSCSCLLIYPVINYCFVCNINIHLLPLRPLKGGHVELTEQNKNLENEEVSKETVEAKDAATDQTIENQPQSEDPVKNADEATDVVAESAEEETSVEVESSVDETSSETEEPVAEEPAAEEPVAEEPVAEEPAAEEPAAKKSPAKGSTEDESDDDDSEEDEIEGKVKIEVNDNPVHDPDAFDWSIDKEGFPQYNDTRRKELIDLYDNTLSSIEEGTVVKGKVVSISKKDVVVNIGFKSDGLVGRTEFKDMPNLAIGDEVEVYVEQTEDPLGQLVLSRRKAVAETAWDRINEAKEKNEILTGYVKSRTKGGLVVDVMGMDAFLPGSQIDVKPIRDYDQYVGQTMEFKVVKINEAFKNVVISHKALIEDDIEAQKGEILSKLEKGQVLEGVVKNMTSFGVFVDLGGLDGLLHITDVSWGRINHPEEVLKLDQKINVVVLDFDDDKKRISLGLKQLTPHPWQDLSEEIQVGAKVKGKVVTVADYGAFIEIEPGIEGLIHVSEMSWSQHLRNPQDFMKVGDEVEAMILTLEKEEHKMSLGIKQLTPDPWEHIDTKYPVGSKHTGEVRNLTNYGLFVELEEGVDGLVHVSDLSWSKKIKHPAEFTKKGEKLEVIVLEIDRDNRRLSLGHKQLDENPWETFESIFTEGSEHEGTVIEVSERGATVAMPYGVEAFAPTKHLKKEDKSTVKADDLLNFRVIEFNKNQKRIIISHTDIWKEEERSKRDTETQERVKKGKQTSKMVDKMNKGVSRDTLGDLGALAELKAKMEATEDAPKAKKAAPAKEEKPVAKKNEVKKDEPKAEASADNAAQLIELIGAGDEASKDDLKQLNGVGPAFEKKLNAAGIYSFAQISKLDETSAPMLEELIGKPGIVANNEWLKQVEELTK